MSPSVSKLNLTAHVISSVAWLGAVAAFLVLSIAGLTSRDTEMLRGAYLSMNLVSLYIIVPMSLAALATGLIQSLGTQWGLFRHYWVLTKFLLALGATILLLLHQFTAVAAAARRVSGSPIGTPPQMGGLGTQLMADAGLAVLLLVVTTTLSVYKPWGRTRYGQRKQDEYERPEALRLRDNKTPFGFKIFLAVIGVLIVAFALLHLTGHGLHHGH